VTTEPTVIVEKDIVAVWAAGYRLLRASGNRFNLSLHAQNAIGVDIADVDSLDPKSVSADVDSLRDVATTIFPKRSAHWNLTPGKFRDHYIPAYSRMLKRGRKSWGCYFLRMVEFGSGKTDQLDDVVRGLSTWGVGHKAAFTIHLSSADTDKPRPLGAPCLQYVQFLVDEKRKLSMTAVYRAHDYFGKALGNLVGLSRLLTFVGAQTNHEIGTLTCHSTYAFIDVTNKKADALLAKIR
jgi:hypothetical protein